MTERVTREELAEALKWYGEQARLCRLIHSEGDAGRHSLSNDGGRRAAAILSRFDAEPATDLRVMFYGSAAEMEQQLHAAGYRLDILSGLFRQR